MTWKPRQPVHLETENYLIRSLTPADVDDRYMGWFEDPDVIVQASLPLGMNVEQRRRHVGAFNNAANFHLGIFCKESGLMVGFFYVFMDYHNKLARTAAIIGDRSYWGKKVVIECRDALFDFLFDHTGIHKIWGKVNTRNMPSAFNYKAQGFTCEGVMREHVE